MQIQYTDSVYKEKILNIKYDRLYVLVERSL